MEMTKSKWYLPAFAVFLGAVVFAAQAIGGNPGSGLVSFGILAGFGAVILVAGERSETVRGLRGDGRDERFKQIDIVATAISGIVVIVVIIVAFIVEVAQGKDGAPYTWLGAIAGLSYLVAVVALRMRS
jgi:drug/metabolite transporter (DMT)-like permease